jgi:hypothetical protein
LRPWRDSPYSYSHMSVLLFLTRTRYAIISSYVVCRRKEVSSEAVSGGCAWSGTAAMNAAASPARRAEPENKDTRPSAEWFFELRIRRGI